MTTHVFQIEGMHCGSCALLIDDALMDLPGVASARTALKTRLATVELDATRTTSAEVVDAVAALGYRAVAAD